MAFSPSFNCLWCGRPHQTRAAEDIEGYAKLCPDCVGRAQDNEFLRFRLRGGLRARAAAPPEADVAPPLTQDTAAEMRAYYAARAPEYDEVYAGLGLPPLDRAVFQADLDAATLWLDRLPISGEIVELAAGTGWWSPLLAQKGQLSIYDAVPETLELARRRLLAHDLRAHIHVRDAWDAPDRQVDALFSGFWLSHVERDRLADFCRIARGWLRPGGTYAFIDEAARAGLTPTADDRQPRRLNDGREFRIPKVYYTPAELEAALHEAGFVAAEVTPTSRFFLLGRATAPA